MDFTLKAYKSLLSALKENGYQFQSYQDYIDSPADKVVMLRHDVDNRKLHSLEFAKIQHEMGIRGTYYFRVVPQSFDEKVIVEIFNLGHEIGYHYEDMDFADGNEDEAIKLFEKHLEKIRAVAPVSTICMHGSPRSKFDNKDVWKKYNYRKYGINGEPYFDLNFDEVFYMTDTGKMWDGFKFSVRDKVKTNETWPVYHSTSDIVTAINKGEFPTKVMMNFHPERWTDNKLVWWKDSIIQNIKNQIKRILIKIR